MFDFLKKKLSGWFGAKEKEEKIPQEKVEKKGPKQKAKKEKPQKPVKVEKEPKKKEKIHSQHVQSPPPKEETPIEEEVTYFGEEESKVKPVLLPPIEQKIQEEVEEEAEEEVEKVVETEVEKEVETQSKVNFFSRLLKKITAHQLTQEEFDEIFTDLEFTLLENNVALEAVDAIKVSLSKDLVGTQLKKEKAKGTILESLKNAILSLLIEPPGLINQVNEKKEPFVMVFFGINGTGKTTTIAKVAHLLKKSNISCVLAAADTFRAASIEQLKAHADRLGVPMVSHQYGTDPAAVAFDAHKYAKAHNIKVILIDTAGRMYTKENLLKEMEKIIRIAKPDLKFFVGESITGNDAIDQAKTFNETIGIDGIILTKADVDEKAGTILSVSHITHKPIYFLGTGQNYEDLTPFTKKTVLKNLGLK